MPLQLWFHPIVSQLDLQGKIGLTTIKFSWGMFFFYHWMECLGFTTSKCCDHWFFFARCDILGTKAIFLTALNFFIWLDYVSLSNYIGPEEIILLEHKSYKKSKSIIDIILHSKISYIILCIMYYQNRILVLLWYVHKK